ncbi:unnamed protein product [Linum trigynum]|uniref:Uncharacterized protein n=1 Tax=Linum trigynum TaxID=586398 RepID=A0AAV2CVZ1_9ROSI
MSVKKSSLSAHNKNNNRQAIAEVNDNAAANGTKRRRFGKWFSFREVSMEPKKSLEKQDSGKLKAEIRRWAKAVATYARQVSGRLGSSLRKSSRIRSSSNSSSSSSSSPSSLQPPLASSSSSISPRL